MAQKQARRRKPSQPKRPVLTVPTVWLQRAAVTLLCAGVVLSVSAVARLTLDVPIASLTIEAPFKRVSQSAVQETLDNELGRGFGGVNLRRMQQDLEALPWVDTVSVRRVWPDSIHVTVTEQQAAARWGESGLLNVRGELFTESARHEFMEMPRLSGPDSELGAVASKYLALRGALVGAGVGGVRAVSLDQRGAWRFILGNGVEVRLGRAEVDVRAERFLRHASPVVVRHAERIRYVDMRYSNGFAVGWKRPEDRAAVREQVAMTASTLEETR
ncbi:MAG: cell division protein FtsQ/DivIB [Pseudomonadota bacterium]